MSSCEHNARYKSLTGFAICCRNGNGVSSARYVCSANDILDVSPYDTAAPSDEGAVERSETEGEKIKIGAKKRLSNDYPSVISHSSMTAPLTRGAIEGLPTI
ncbi:MAG: hypothetical protein IJY56_04715 [Clostridia bacterium]|nr:hypothetical protein [Clostridia bacterium]